MLEHHQNHVDFTAMLLKAEYGFLYRTLAVVFSMIVGQDSNFTVNQVHSEHAPLVFQNKVLDSEF